MKTGIAFFLVSMRNINPFLVKGLCFLVLASITSMSPLICICVGARPMRSFVYHMDLLSFNDKLSPAIPRCQPGRSPAVCVIEHY